MKKPGVGGAAAPPYRFWLTDTFNRTRGGSLNLEVYLKFGF